MHRQRFPDRATHSQGSTESLAVQRRGPGKRTLTEDLAVQQREPGGAALAAPPDQVQGAAARGLATPAARLPFADTIQRAFGRHDLSSVKAHAGPDAAASAGEMGAQAYATGDHVVLGKGADLFTVAHEAAHVVQQRQGVHLKGGVGEDGDAYEQHANAVAEAVVSGQSAEGLLDSGADGGSSAPELEDDADDGELDVPDEVLADEGWSELAPALDDAVDAAPGADRIDPAQLEQRVGRAPRPAPADLKRLDLKPVIARGVELLGGGPGREIDDDPAAAPARATPGGIQMERGRRDRGTLTSNRAQHRYQQGQRKQQARRQKTKGGRARRREEERRERRNARTRHAAKVNWTGVLLLMLVLGASAIELDNTISRGRPPQRGPEPKDPEPSPRSQGNTTGSTGGSPVSSPTVPSESVTVGGGGTELARLPTSEIASRLNASNPTLFKMVSKRWNGTVFDIESGFKVKSNVETTSLQMFLDKCRDDECRALVKAYYLKNGIDNTLVKIWSDGHELAIIGENHEDESSQLIKTHLACGFTPGQRYIHFEEGITRNLAKEQSSVEQRCQTTDGPNTPQRVVRGVESELQLSLAAAASTHDEFANGRATLDSREPEMVRAVLMNDVMKPHLVGLLSSLPGGVGDLLRTLLKGDSPPEYVQSDWVDLTGAMTRVLVKDAEAAKMDVGVVKTFLDKPTDRARSKQLSDEVIVGARNVQWSKVIEGSMKELEGVKAVVVLGDKHATGLAKLLGKELAENVSPGLSDGATPPSGESEKPSGESEKPSGESDKPSGGTGHQGKDEL
jgi:hypothetical protein